MVIVSVLYPNDAGARFDLGYYRDTHLPLVRRLLEPCGMRALTWVLPAGHGAAFRLIAELRFDTMAQAEVGLGLHGAQTQADIVNFTEIVPVVLLGEQFVA